MTLILATICPDYGVLVVDRRYTPMASGADDERNKIVTVAGDNGRVAVAFTGLARVTGIFQTGDWLVNALYESLNPHGDIGRMIEDLRGRADVAFEMLPPHARKEPLSFVGVGFSYTKDPPLPLFFVVTNDRRQAIVDWGEFEGRRFGLSLGTNGSRRYEDTFMLAYGSTQAVDTDELVAIQDLARQAKPPEAVKNKAAELIQTAARRVAAAGTIGLQCGAAIVPVDPGSSIRTDYIVGANSSTSYMPAHVMTHGAVKDGRMWSEDRSPVVVPKVGRNQPCPCGSGMKYKRCHYRSEAYR